MHATKEAGGPARGDSRPANQCDTAERHRTSTPPIQSAPPRWRHNSPPHRATSGYLSREAVEAGRDAVDIAKVAGRFTDLRPTGNGELAALCPIQEERTPSFSINVAKGVFRCFGCGKAGDVFRLVMLTESLTFPAAVRRVAAIGGIPLKGNLARTTIQQHKLRAESDRRRRHYELVRKFRGWVGRAFQSYHAERAAVYSAYERSQWYCRTREQAEAELSRRYDREAVLEEYLRILTEGTEVEQTELLSHVA